MAERRLGLIMHGITGRMGYNQHLVRSILAIREQGGVVLANGDRLMPDPILVGRDGDKLERIAKRHGIARWTTDVAKALAKYVEGTGTQFNGLLTLGDNFYVPLKDVEDYQFQSLFEDMFDAKRLNFPFLAGSSLPVTWRLPPVEVPYGAKLDEALMVGVGGSDPMDYHALEAMQCMVERRQGGETGIKAVQLIEGDDVWKAGEEGRWSKRLLEAALSRSDSLQGDSELDSRPQDLANNGQLPKLVKNPAAYFIERNDGLRTTLLMLNGALQDYCFAAQLANGEIVSTQFFLPPTPNVTYSACLVAQIEEMIVTGRAPYPVERTQIASAMLDRCLDSKVEGHRRIETPELNIRYRAPKESRFGG